MAVIEHSIDIDLPAHETAAEWDAFPFRSLAGFFRPVGQRLHWHDGRGNEAWGATLMVGLGQERTRVVVKLDYFPAADGTPPATVNAHVFADLTMFRRFVESDAARHVAHEPTVG